jgi:hypothetical protein
VVALDGHKRGHRCWLSGCAPDDHIGAPGLACQHRGTAEAEPSAHLVLDITEIIDRALSVWCSVAQPCAQPIVRAHPSSFGQRVDEPGSERVRAARVCACLEQDGGCTVAHAAVVHRNTRCQRHIAFLRVGAFDVVAGEAEARMKMRR